MNQVNNLIKVKFSALPLEEKLEIEHLGPHQPEDFKQHSAWKGHSLIHQLSVV